MRHAETAQEATSQMLEIAALSSLAPIVSGVIGHISSSLEASKTKREVEAAAAAADVNLERGYKLLRESLAGLVELLAVNLVKRPELQAATFRSLVDLRLLVRDVEEAAKGHCPRILQPSGLSIAGNWEMAPGVLAALQGRESLIRNTILLAIQFHQLDANAAGQQDIRNDLSRIMAALNIQQDTASQVKKKSDPSVTSLLKQANDQVSSGDLHAKVAAQLSVLDCVYLASVLRVSGYKDQALIYASTVNSRWDEIKGMDKVVIGGAECELGVCYYAMRDIDKATAYLRSALMRGSSEPIAYKTLEKIHVRKKRTQHWKQEWWIDLSRQIWDKREDAGGHARELAYSSYRCHHHAQLCGTKGLCEIWLARCRSANEFEKLRMAEYAHALDPKDVTALLLIAEWHGRLTMTTSGGASKRITEAIDAFNDVLRVDPGNEPAIKQLKVLSRKQAIARTLGN